MSATIKTVNCYTEKIPWVDTPIMLLILSYVSHYFKRMMDIYGINFAYKSNMNKLLVNYKIDDIEKVIGSVCKLYNSSNMDMFYFFAVPYLKSVPTISCPERIERIVTMYNNDIMFIQKENNIKIKMCHDLIDKKTENMCMKTNMRKAICALQFVARKADDRLINMFQKEKTNTDMKVLLNICRTDFGCFSRIFDILIQKNLTDNVVSMMKIMVDYVHLRNLSFDLAFEQIVTSEYFSDEHEVILLIFCKRDTELHKACVSLLNRTRPFSAKCDKDIKMINSSLNHLYCTGYIYTDKHGISRLKKTKYATNLIIARYKTLLCPSVRYLTETVITELIVNCMGKKQSHYRKKSNYHCKTGECNERLGSMYLENGYCSCKEEMYDNVCYDCAFDEDDYDPKYDDFYGKKRHEQKYDTKSFKREDRRIYNESIVQWEDAIKPREKEEEDEPHCPADDNFWCYYCDNDYGR